MPHFRYLDSPEPVRRYLELKALIAELTAEMKAMEDEIWNAVDAEGGTADAFGHRLECCIARTYRYSPAVQEAEAALRTMKATERAAKTATIEKATGYVRVTARPAADLGTDGEPMIDLDALAAEVDLTHAERQPEATPF